VSSTQKSQTASDGTSRVVRRVFRASKADDNRMLGDFLARRCPEAPAGFLNRLLRKDFVLVNGVPAAPRARLRRGQRVVLTLPPGAFLVAPNPEVRFQILYEDESLLVVDKPAGIVSEPGIGHKLDTLLNGLIARYGEQLDRLGPRSDFGMVHRLDRDTSGLLVVAKQAAVQRMLAGQFRQRRVRKRYVALLLGDVKRSAGEIELPLGRTRRRGRAVGLVGAQGTRHAVTRFRVVERFETATLVEASPQTGRWRQLRLHFKAFGHPVAGDEEGVPEANRELAARYGLRRMFLHAGALQFTHPRTGRRIAVSAPLPAELETVLRAFRSERRRRVRVVRRNT